MQENKELDSDCLYGIDDYHGYKVCFWFGLDFLCNKNCPERRTLKDIEAAKASKIPKVFSCF